MRPADFHFKDPNWSYHNAEILSKKEKDPFRLGYGGRKYQVNRFKKLRGEPRTLTIAPTGSGKTLMQVIDAGDEIIRTNYRKKQVFIVPQTNIGYGFTEKKYPKIKIGRKTYIWEVTCNCLDEKGSVTKIRNFLLSRPSCKSYKKQGVIGGVTAVVTYSAIIAAWKTFSLAEKTRIIKTTSFRLDEGHHQEGVGEESMNKLGEFCNHIFKKNGFLHTVTATFFRGNRRTVIAEKYLKNCEIYTIKFMEHWKVLGIEELLMSYVCFDDATDLLSKILRAIRKEPNKSPIIIIPSNGCGLFRRSDKQKWVKKLVDGLQKIYGADSVLDLVSSETQIAHRDKLISANQNFSAIVTCMIGREGADWPPCSRVYNLTLDQSVLLAIQKLGRSLRQYPSKTNVQMINYIESFDDWNEASEKVRKKLSDRFNAIVVASILDDMFCPLIIPALEKKKGNSRGYTLDEVYGANRHNVVEELMLLFLSIPPGSRSPDVVDEVIEDIIKAFANHVLVDVSEDALIERLRLEILRRQNSNNPRLKIAGINVDFVRKHGGWDKVFQEFIAHNSPFVGRAKTRDLQHLHKLLVGTWAKQIEEIKQIGIENLDKDSALYRFLKIVRAQYKRQQC